MPDKPQLHHPWLVAVWPGMGQVAFNAGVYLLAKLDMNLLTYRELDDAGAAPGGVLRGKSLQGPSGG